MDRSYIPITRFYQNCLPAARNNGYNYVMCLLARDRAVDGLYSTLEQEWFALDDITGKDFLFMFTGKHTKDDRDYCSAIMGRDRLLCNEYLHVMNRNTHGIESTYDFRDRETRGRFTSDLPKEHTRMVSELRELFGISEGDIPCLVYTNLFNKKNIVVPFGGSSLYGYFRKLYIRLEKLLREINLLSRTLIEYEAIKNSKVVTLRAELFQIADSLVADEKGALVDCITNMSYGKFRQDIRSKLNQYIDLSKNACALDNEKMALIQSGEEPQNTQQKLSALYEQVDEIILCSVVADEPSSVFLSPSIEMRQYGSNSAQIGMVTSGGTVNIIDADWRFVILRKTFDMLEDFLTFMKPFLDERFEDRNSYYLNNRLQDITGYYERHQSDLGFLSEYFEALAETSQRYSDALLEGGFYSKKGITASAAFIISDCVNSYWNVITEMTQRIRAEVSSCV